MRPGIGDSSADESQGSLRVLAVIPGDEHGPSMVFAKRQSRALTDAGCDCQMFFLSSRTSLPAVGRELLRLRRTIAEMKPHVVHAHYGSVTSLLCTLATGRPVIAQFRGSDLLAPGGSPRARLARLMSQLSALRAWRIICVSAELQRSLWWNRGRVAVVPSGVDVDRFEPQSRVEARRQLGWDPDQPVVVFNAGRDPVVKGKELADRVLALVRDTIPAVGYEVLDGQQDPDSIPLVFNAADCLLLTSISEGSPTVVQEAMATGLPVVSVPVGDVRERLRYVVPSAVCEADPRLLAEQVLRILAAPTRSNGRDHALECSLQNINRRVLELYRDAMD